jgi:mannose-6-phosphate isomerase-like protein (cupin superfamily)
MPGKGKLLRMRDIKSVCPPKHSNTDAFALITKNTVGAQHVEFFLTEIHPGGEAEEDVHPISEHAYFMCSGRGLATVEGEEFIVEPGDCLYIPMGAKHGIKPIGGETIRFTVFMAPPRQ